MNDSQNKHSEKNNINVLRRKLVQNSWVAPLITMVSLPSHAQSSNPDVVDPVIDPPVVPPVPTSPLIHISSVLSNPFGGDCGPSARELVSITNAGDGEGDLSGVVIQRRLFFFDDTLANLSGSIAPGQTIDIDVCDGIVEGDSAVLNNGNGGTVILRGPNGIIDIVNYPSATNASGQGIPVLFGPTPSTSTARNS